MISICQNLKHMELNHQCKLFFSYLNIYIFFLRLFSELLRQYQDFGGLYDRETLKWIEIQDVILCAACGPPGGGRNPTSARLLRHFAIFAIPAPAEYSLKHIFKSILNGYLTDFNQNTKTAGDGIIDAAVEIYQRMSAELLPTPTKSHYVFNLRDLSKCIQGILQVRMKFC